MVAAVPDFKDSEATPFSHFSPIQNIQAILGDEQALTPIIYLKSFDMDSMQVGKAVFVKESYTTLGIEPRT